MLNRSWAEQYFVSSFMRTKTLSMLPFFLTPELEFIVGLFPAWSKISRLIIGRGP